MTSVRPWASWDSWLLARSGSCWQLFLCGYAHVRILSDVKLTTSCSPGPTIRLLTQTATHGIGSTVMLRKSIFEVGDGELIWSDQMYRHRWRWLGCEVEWLKLYAKDYNNHSSYFAAKINDLLVFASLIKPENYLLSLLLSYTSLLVFSNHFHNFQ